MKKILLSRLQNDKPSKRRIPKHEDQKRFQVGLVLEDLPNGERCVKEALLIIRSCPRQLDDKQLNRQFRHIFYTCRAIMGKSLEKMREYCNLSPEESWTSNGAVITPIMFGQWPIGAQIEINEEKKEVIWETSATKEKDFLAKYPKGLATSSLPKN